MANSYVSLLQVAKIKERVEEKEGIPPVQQRLIFGGKQMYVTAIYTFAGYKSLPLGTE
jgi:hypothetical protein